MAWIELHQAVWTHRKTFELAALLGVDETYAAAHVIRLWTWALDNAPDGDLSPLSERAIAYGAGWRHEAGLFLRALIEAGWLDADRAIHDWDKYGGKLVKRREEDAERKRVSRGVAPDVRGTSNGTAAGFRRREEDTRGQETRGEGTTVPTPQPPPRSAAEGARNISPNISQPANQRRRSRSQGVTTAEPPQREVPADLAPPTDVDLELWDAARERLTEGWLPANAAKAEAFEPLGRDPSGWLWIRAPASARSVASQPQIATALVGAGDPFGTGVRLVTNDGAPPDCVGPPRVVEG